MGKIKDEVVGIVITTGGVTDANRQLVVAFAAVDRIIAVTAIDRIITDLAKDQIIASPARDDVIAVRIRRHTQADIVQND